MPEYINPPGPSIDPTDVSDGVVDYIREFFPEWDPNEGQLAWIIVLALALRIAELDDLARMIPRSIYRNYGLKVLNFAPVDALPAAGLINITVRDGAGYTFAADDVRVNVEDPSGGLHEFVADDDVVIPADVTSVTSIPVTATVEGTQANGIVNGPTTLAEALDPVINVVQFGTTSGGLDAEDDDTYLNRLTRRLSLVARPVTAQDFASLILVQYPQVFRAFTIDNYIPAKNEIQSLQWSGATSGTGAVTLPGNGTVTLNYNDTAADVQTKITALGPVGLGRIKCSGGPLNTPTPVLIEYTGSWAGQDFPSITATGSFTPLTGISIVTVQQGSPPVPNSEKSITIGAIDAEGQPITSALKDEISIYLQTQRPWGFIVSFIDPTLTVVDVTFSFTTQSGYIGADVKLEAEAAVLTYLSPATWAALPGDARSGNTESIVYLWELVTVINSVRGVDKLLSMEIGPGGGLRSANNFALPGSIPIPSPGIVVGTAL